MTSQHIPHHPAPHLSPERERLMLLTLAGIQFVHILDFMIMMPLGPVLIRELHIDAHQFGLLVSAYTFTAALTGLVAAAIVDRFERKRLILTVFCLFTAATLACGLASDYLSLLAARSMAGAFGGILGSMVYAMVGDLIPFERRGRASATIMSAFAISTVAGVPLSLFLANHLGWRSPFVFIAVMCLALFALGLKALPVVRGHLEPVGGVNGSGGSENVGESPAASLSDHPLAAMAAVLRDPNHLRALAFTILVMFSGFTVIPYITVYITANVGIRQEDIPLIYLVGGIATLFSSRLVGRLADQRGKVLVYRVMAVCSLFPLFIVTHLGPIPLWLMITCSVVFFIFVPGRMVPTMAIITSAAEPRLRGTFMSMNGAAQQFASGAAAYAGGLLITVSPSGQVIGYGNVGFVAIAATLVAFAFVGQIRLHTTPQKQAA